MILSQADASSAGCARNTIRRQKVYATNGYTRKLRQDASVTFVRTSGWLTAVAAVNIWQLRPGHTGLQTGQFNWSELS